MRQPKVPQSRLDRAIGVVFPGWAVGRAKARYTLGAVTGGYTGGQRRHRRFKNWNTGGGSADAELLPDLEGLRERSRDLVRNAPLATAAINSAVSAVVGSGLRVNPSLDREVLGINDKAATQFERDAERVFRRWGKSQECDAARTLNFATMQDVAFRSALENGDVFIVRRFVRRAGSSFGVKLQLIEADRVSNPNNAMDRPGLAGGVEFDPISGAPIAYHMTKQHPGDRLKSRPGWVRIPAFDADGRRRVLHLYRQLRPEQRRGVPYLAPVVESFKQLDRYTQAELDASVLNAFFAVMTKSPDGSSMAPATGESAPGDTESRPELKVESGTIGELGPGEEIASFTPGRPNSAFEAFESAVMRQIGAALEQPFEVILKHYRSSYSAARAAMLDAWKFYRGRRRWLGDGFCQPVYEWVQADAVASGALRAPGFFRDPVLRDAWCGAQWVGDSQGQIDPVKETTAAVARIDNGLSTHMEETTALTGGDWERNYEQLAREKQKAAEQGLLSSAPALEDHRSDEDDEDPDDADKKELADANAA